MDNITRRDSGMLYISDEAVYNEQKRSRILTQKLNTMDRSDYEGIAAVIRELFGRAENAMVNPPFYCDYGDHIFVGKNFFANYTPKKFTIIHKSGKAPMKYAVGSLNAGGERFRVILYVKTTDAESHIEQLKVERE